MYMLGILLSESVPPLRGLLYINVLVMVGYHANFFYVYLSPAYFCVLKKFQNSKTELKMLHWMV